MSKELLNNQETLRALYEYAKDEWNEGTEARAIIDTAYNTLTQAISRLSAIESAQQSEALKSLKSVYRWIAILEDSEHELNPDNDYKIIESAILRAESEHAELEALKEKVKVLCVNPQ